MDDWFRGDGVALSAAEDECNKLTKEWLKWLDAQSCGPLPAIRFDFYVHIFV